MVSYRWQKVENRNKLWCYAYRSSRFTELLIIVSTVFSFMVFCWASDSILEVAPAHDSIQWMTKWTPSVWHRSHISHCCCGTLLCGDHWKLTSCEMILDVPVPVFCFSIIPFVPVATCFIQSAQQKLFSSIPSRIYGSWWNCFFFRRSYKLMIVFLF